MHAQLEYTLSPVEIVQANAAQHQRSWRSTFHFWLGLYIFGLSMAELGREGFRWLPLLGGTLPGLYFLMDSQPWFRRTKFWAALYPAIDVKITLGDDSLTAHFAPVNSRYRPRQVVLPWDRMAATGVMGMADGFLTLAYPARNGRTPIRAVAIPLRVFETRTEQAEFESLIRERMSPSPALHEPLPA